MVTADLLGHKFDICLLAYPVPAGLSRKIVVAFLSRFFVASLSRMCDTPTRITVVDD